MFFSVRAFVLIDAESGPSAETAIQAALTSACADLGFDGYREVADPGNWRSEEVTQCTCEVRAVAGGEATIALARDCPFHGELVAT